MDIMGTVGMLVVGLVCGAIARFILPGEQKMGWFMTALLGAAGSVGATFIGQALGWYKAGSGAGYIGAVIGAIVLLLLWNMISKKSK